MKLFRILVYIIGFFLLLIVLLPKKELYYYLESELKKEKIVISNESVDDTYLGLRIKNGILYYEELKVGEIESISIYLLLFYNSIELKNFKVYDDAATILPRNTKRLELRYTILDPLAIKLFAIGDFGELKGTYKVLDKKFSLELNATELMKQNYSQLLTKMRFENGVYKYEQNFK